MRHRRDQPASYPLRHKRKRYCAAASWRCMSNLSQLPGCRTAFPSSRHDISRIRDLSQLPALVVSRGETKTFRLPTAETDSKAMRLLVGTRRKSAHLPTYLLTHIGYAYGESELRSPRPRCFQLSRSFASNPSSQSVSTLLEESVERDPNGTAWSLQYLSINLADYALGHLPWFGLGGIG